MKKLFLIMMISYFLTAFADGVFDLSLSDVAENYMTSYKESASLFLDDEIDSFICKVAADSGNIAILTQDRKDVLYYYDINCNLLWSIEFNLSFNFVDLVVSDNGSTIMINQAQNRGLAGVQIVIDKRGRIIFDGIIRTPVDDLSPDGKFLIPPVMNLSSPITYIYNTFGEEFDINTGYINNSKNLQFKFFNENQLLLFDNFSKITSFTKEYDAFQKNWFSDIDVDGLESIVIYKKFIIIKTEEDEFWFINEKNGFIESKYSASNTEWIISSSKDIYFKETRNDNSCEFGRIRIDADHYIEEETIDYDINYTKWTDVIKIDGGYLFNITDSNEFIPESEIYRTKLLNDNQLHPLKEKFYYTENNKQKYLIAVGTDEESKITVFEHQ